MLNKKAVLSQRRPRNAPYIGALKIFESPWLRLRLLFPTFLVDYCSDNLIDPVNMHTKFDVRSFTRSWGTQKIEQSLDTPMHPFLQNF